MFNNTILQGLNILKSGIFRISLSQTINKTNNDNNNTTVDITAVTPVQRMLCNEKSVIMHYTAGCKLQRWQTYIPAAYNSYQLAMLKLGKWSLAKRGYSTILTVTLYKMAAWWHFIQMTTKNHNTSSLSLLPVFIILRSLNDIIQ